MFDKLRSEEREGGMRGILTKISQCKWRDDVHTKELEPNIQDVIKEIHQCPMVSERKGPLMAGDIEHF